MSHGCRRRSSARPAHRRDPGERFASAEDLAEVDRTFREGGKGYGHYKLQLLELFHAQFDGARAKRKELESDRAYVDETLRKGATRARDIAAPVMDAVRRAVGMDRQG